MNLFGLPYPRDVTNVQGFPVGCEERRQVRNSNPFLIKFSFNSPKKEEGFLCVTERRQAQSPGVTNADGDWLAVQVRLIRNAHILKRG